MRKNVTVFLIIGTLFVACNNTESEKATSEVVRETTNEEAVKVVVEPNVMLSGVLKNGVNRTLILEGNEGEKTIEIGRTVTNKDGEFQLEAAIPEMGLYQLRLAENVSLEEQQKIIPLTLVPEDEVVLELDADDYNLSVVYKGTDWAAALDGFMKELNAFVEWQRSIKNPDELDREELIQLFNDRRKKMEQYVVTEINKDPSNPANMLLMNNLMPMMGFDNYDASYVDVLNKLKTAYEETYPESPISLDLSTQITQLEQSWKDYEDFKLKNVAPEIVLPNPDGKEMKLSSLRGSYVLIDFWAAWCPPCRAENPNVVRLYNKYKDKNFKIFSVSLDDNVADWKKAIKDDGLIWEHHVSDLKKWNSPLIQKYQFNGIPYTVFIDPEGKIIAENLRGITLERKLQELFGG